VDRKRRKVLFVSENVSQIEAILTHFPVADFDVHRMVRTAGAARLLDELAFDVVVVSPPLDGARDLIKILRSRLSPSRDAAFLVVTDDDAGDKEDRWWLDRPYSVVKPKTGASRLSETIQRILHRARRTQSRVPIRVAYDRRGVQEQSLCQTVSLSSTGLLLAGCKKLPIEDVFTFEMQLPTETLPLRGKAKVVRHADIHVESTSGIAAEFVDLTELEQKKIESYVVWQAARNAGLSNGIVATGVQPEAAPEDVPAEAATAERSTGWGLVSAVRRLATPDSA
jgi:hypothetical protein